MIQNAILEISDDLIARESELCQLDSIVGDGDHGVTVKRGFLAIREKVADQQFNSIQQLMMTCAMELMNTLGGAIGPIFASIFMGMAKSTAGKETLETADVADMFEAGLQKVMATGGAKVGDRTLVDTLAPAVDALKAHQDKSIKEALGAAADAGYAGAQSTKDMVAQKGRAKFLGESSKGYVDAGSMTMYYFLRAMQNAVE